MPPIHSHSEYEAARAQALADKRTFLDIALRYPYMEFKEYTKAYTGPQHNPKSVRYYLYVEALFNMVQQLFDSSHCDKYPENPCDSICEECIERVVSVVNISRYLDVHRAWWDHHCRYYEDHHPVYARFIDQICAILDAVPDTADTNVDIAD